MRRTTLALALIALAGCARNPVTHKRQLAFISEGQEVQMGKQAAQDVAQQIGLYPNPGLQQYVQSVGVKIAKTTERPDLPWSFQVVNDGSVNAFALPGGPIFVTRGLLAHMGSEAELAGVLGHEIGHITARHAVSNMSEQALAQLGLGVGGIFSPVIRKYGQLAGAGLQLIFLKYSRDDETQADGLGFKYMLGHGYDPRGLTALFQTLDRVGQAKSAGRLPQWLQTHPDPGNRVQANEQRVAGLNKDLTGATRGADSYLAQLDGLVYGDDPRDGYFKGADFFHPNLKLKLTFPAGWKTANEPQLVGAISPAEDALVALTHAGNAAPDLALQQFAQKQGIQALRPAALSIAGLPTASTYFQAQTEQGAIEGLTAFVSYGGKTFQLLGYAVAGRLGTYEPAFRASMQSFAPLADPAALGVQPARIKIVTVPRDMSVQEFNQQFPSTVPAEEVALANGLAAAGSFHAGQKAKQIVGGTPAP